MKTTTARFPTRARAEAALNDLVAKSFEPARLEVQLARPLGKVRRPEVKPLSVASAGWGALIGASSLSIGGLALSVMGYADTIATLALAETLAAILLSAGLGAIVGAYAGLANWTVSTTLDPGETGPILVRYRGPDQRARAAAAVMEAHGATALLAA